MVQRSEYLNYGIPMSSHSEYCLNKQQSSEQKIIEQNKKVKFNYNIKKL